MAINKGIIGIGAASGGANDLGIGDMMFQLDFEDQVVDLTGNYSMTANNITYSTDSVFGTKSADFNGTNSYIITEGSSDFSINQFSISTWIKIDTFTHGGQLITRFGQNSGGGGIPSEYFFHFRQYNTLTLNGTIYNGAGSGVNTSAGSNKVTVGNWMNIVYVSAGSNTRRWYVNNVLVKSHTSSIPINVQAKNLGIQFGAIGNVTHQSPSDIKLDNVRMFSKALSVAQINTLYNE
jgi:hypothetical protein|tara:strand:+ start:2087 stop:2794 length:708 start_codon:yes stop_codon:yes gene_type:complete